MDRESLLMRLKNSSKPFFDKVGEANELIYLVLLTLYVTIYFMLKVAWKAQVFKMAQNLRFALLGMVMWGAGLYLFFIIVAWKDLWNKTVLLLIIGAIILASIYYFSRTMSTNAYGVVMDLFFCIMAYKKDYKKILRCLLGVTVVMLIIAGIGQIAGYTYDMAKPDTSIPGHSLGINYPNTWGYLVFLGLLLFWYLYLKKKPVLAFIIFWPVGAFMYYYVVCRTIAGLSVIFPVLAILVYFIEKRADKKALDNTAKQNKLLEFIVISIPFIAWAFMMFNSYQVKWWHQYYHGPLRNLAWRFIQGGLYFQTYGLPLIGNPYRSNVYTYVNVNGEFIKVGILDSSFAAYIIMRGILWLICTLLWLCIAHWKALKKRDYAIILIETVILGFAMMERPGLDLWYNFVLLYPLAKVVSNREQKQA